MGFWLVDTESGERTAFEDETKYYKTPHIPELKTKGGELPDWMLEKYMEQPPNQGDGNE